MSDDGFQLLYADPAWRFDPWSRETGLGRAPDQHYPTMPLDEMMRLPVGEWAAPNALLAMWAYDPMLPAAWELAKAWGFEWVTVLFRWVKTTEHPGQLFLFPVEKPDSLTGLGYHSRHGDCEELFLFKRGRGLPVMRHDINCVFYDLVREHSRKPDVVYNKLEALYGDVRRMELFARTQRCGWTAWGNEIDKFRAVV